MTRMANGFTPTDLTDDERNQLRGVRKRKMDLLEEIEMIKNELREVDNELESMYYMDDSGKSRLKILSNARRKFNKDPNNGIQYLIDRGLLENSPKAIAEWLFQGDGLSKTAIGDFLGNNDDRSLNILKQYTNCFDFSGIFLVDAIRIFLKSFRLPGESQKIDRIMDSFANQYVTSNSKSFPSADACHSIAFSCIMLNTLLYNPNIKDRITLEGYIDMCKEYLTSDVVTVETLNAIYDSLKNAQFAMPIEERGSAAIHLNAEREGWLYKQSSGQFVAGPLAWKRRWFVLSEQCLYYFEQTNESEPRGIIPLQNVGIRRVEASSRPHMFEIFSLSDDRIKACKTEQDGRLVEGRHSVYRICAANQEDLRKQKSVLTIRDPRWQHGIQNISFQENSTEEAEEFDPFNGLINSNNIVCPSCKFSADPETEREAIVAHYKTQWHRNNLARISKGKQLLTEEEFENAVEDDDSMDSSDEEESTMFNLRIGSLSFFQQKEQVFSIYRSILHPRELNVAKQNFIRPLNCAILLLAGGHFAGAIYKNGIMTHHRTLSRYVIRAKQGKAQANQDGKGAAGSAGSSLRRHNEQVLKMEIIEILTKWKEALADAPLIFLRCASYQKSTFDIEGILNRKDPRMRSIPFATKRPSLVEAKAIWERLHFVGEYGSLEEFTEKMEELKKKHLVKKNLQKKKKVVLTLSDTERELEKLATQEKKKDHIKITKGDDQKQDPWPEVSRSLRVQLLKIATRDDLGQFRSLIESSENPDETKRYLSEVKLPPNGFSFLHSMAGSGLRNVLQYLLELHCDPTIQDDEGRVPYAMSASKNVKNIFIEFREANPDLWPYGKTHIPVIQELTEEQKARLEEKKKEKKQKQREREKEKKVQVKREAEEQKAKEAFSNLSEREKRALAAEARLGTLSRCANCATVLPKVPFVCYDVNLCSTACVAAYRSRFEVNAKNT